MSPSASAHARRRLFAGAAVAALAAVAVFIALRALGGGSGAASSAAPAPVPVRLSSNGKTLASRPIDRLQTHREVDHWLSAAVPTSSVEVSGRAHIKLQTNQVALDRRLHHSIAAGGGAVAVPRQPVSADIRLPVIAQTLHNDCEATALSMLLLDRGRQVDQLTLQNELPQSAPLTPEQASTGTGPITWGDPARGFVGSASGNGYGVYQRPVAALARRHGVALRDLTGAHPQAVYRALLAGHPVMAWVALSSGPYETWRTPGGRIVHANFGEHTVVLTGIDGGSLTVNDPLSGQRLTWTKTQFEQMWSALGHRALAA